MSPENDDGFATTELVVVSAFSMLILVAVLNLIVFQYAKGTLHAAVDQGVRAGATLDATAADCEAKLNSTLGNLLGGAMNAQVTSRTCVEGAETMTATVQGSFSTWLDFMPAWNFDISASVVKEPVPEPPIP